jgi:hypothetical protein
MLHDLAELPDAINTDADRNLCKGPEETLTFQRLGLPELLRITIRDFSRNARPSSECGTAIALFFCRSFNQHYGLLIHNC